MKKTVILFFLGFAVLTQANPLELRYIFEVQIKPISRFELLLPTGVYSKYSVITKSGSFPIDSFYIDSTHGCKVISDEGIIGTFILDDSCDYIRLKDSLDRYMDEVYWPMSYPGHSFNPPDSGASAELFGYWYEEDVYTYYKFVWHTNRQPSFGYVNTDIPYGVEDNKPIETKVTMPWLNTFPNPMKSRAVISFYVPIGEKYKLCIYDLAGRLVSDLDDGVGTGKYSTAIWNGKNKNDLKVAAGNYLMILESNGKKYKKKITLIR